MRLKLAAGIAIGICGLGLGTQVASATIPITRETVVTVPAQPASSQNPLAFHPTPLPPEKTLDAQPLRVWTRDDRGNVSLTETSSLPQYATKPPHIYDPVGKDTLDRTLKAVDKARMAALQELEKSPYGRRVVPKDCSLHPTAFNMFYESGDDRKNLGYITQMAEIGTHEGFHTVVSTDDGQSEAIHLKAKLPKNLQPDVSIVPVPGNDDVWVEDHGEITVDGTITVPARVGDPVFIQDAILHDRVQRFYPGVHADVGKSDWELWSLLEKSYPRAAFPPLGFVDSRHNQESMVALGLAAHMPVRENLSYLEGGNVLPGTLPNGEGFALVGRDSVAVTRALMQRDLKRNVDDREVREAIGKDLGVKPENVHPIEQPGTFHIDMTVALLGPGQVLLNDSREVARLQTQWLRDDLMSGKPRPLAEGASLSQQEEHQQELAAWHLRDEIPTERRIEALNREAASRAFYEDKTAKDLEGTGLSVYRMAAVFMNPDNPSEDIANFSNLRQVTNPGGGCSVIALGGPPRAEQYVARKLLGEIPGDVRHIWFLDRKLTPLTLELLGGIKCRTKGEGVVGPAPEPTQTK